MASLIAGALIAAITGYLAERYKRDWRRKEERDQWLRQARLEAYGRFLGDDRLVTDAAAKVRNLGAPELWEERHRQMEKAVEAVSGFEVASGQTVLVASEALIEATNELRTQVLSDITRAAEGEPCSESLRSGRLMFTTIARVELGIRFDLEDELKVLKKSPKGPKSSSATID